MCLKALDNIFRNNFQRVTFLAVVTIVAGCSSGSQRFSNIVSHHRGLHQSNIANSMSTDPGMLSYGGEMIQSTELPPVEPSDDSWIDDNSPQQGREAPSDDRVMGAPPRNLGKLSRSQMDSSPIFRQNSYIVQSGDTLLSIARQVGVSVEALKSVNGINSNSIYIGQVLVLPSRRVLATSKAPSYNDWATSKVESSFQSQMTSSTKHKKASPIYKAPVTTPPSTQVNRSNSEKNSSKQMQQLNHESDLSSTVTRTDNIKTPQATGISKMRWPVRGRLLSQFGQKKGTIMNRGIDIAVPEGSSVKAAENGVVIYAGDGLKELGNVVMIRHENNIITIYGCNSQLVVNKGQRIRRGDEIAKSGVSGNVKTPRVYFEMRKNSLPVDPLKYLEN
ncbi:M23 family metallopeptidase [Bartonella sp. AU55XJBT]|uniref:M23 family metallopeptidase n=1 Tax=Bartonella sp. AU55XJBT TaxID=3019091 RepID=UPI00235E5157|nr:M23 family metallopeptidase [Bartonella sp. AU55XJBT]